MTHGYRTKSIEVDDMILLVSISYKYDNFSEPPFSDYYITSVIDEETDREVTRELSGEHYQTIQNEINSNFEAWIN